MHDHFDIIYSDICRWGASQL